MLRGTTYLNNTAAIIEHIGEGEVNSLKCTTALETCCQSSGQGDFYYPNGAQVMIESGGENLYRTRSSRSISLNRRGGNTSLGEYRCEIPDGRGILQNLYITIGKLFYSKIYYDNETCHVHMKHVQEQIQNAL